MGDWIDALGNEEEQRRKAEELRLQSQFHRAEVIRQKKDALWASLITVLNRDVEKFCATFKGRRTAELTTLPGLRFRISKSPYPTILMEAEIGPDGTTIKVNYSRISNHVSPMERAEETFEITLDPSDQVLIAHNGRVFNTLDKVSRFMLEPVFTGE